jgi:hypothetical protein
MGISPGRGVKCQSRDIRNLNGQVNDCPKIAKNNLNAAGFEPARFPTAGVTGFFTEYLNTAP